MAVLDRTLCEADKRDSQGGLLANNDRGDLARVDELWRPPEPHGRAQSTARWAYPHVWRRHLRPRADRLGLVHEYRINVHPIAFGKGYRLFGGPVDLVLQNVRRFGAGSVAYTYASG